MNKIKLFSCIIAGEIVIILFLLAIFLIQSNQHTTTQKKIFFNEKVIYSDGGSVPFTGKILDTLDNKLIVEFNVVNGFKQGEFCMLKFDGTYAVLGYMNKNKNDGAWKYFFENGKIECAGSFKDDEPSGKWIWYYQNGLIRCEGKYINGKHEGLWIKYDQQGNTSRIVNYRMGEVISNIQLNTPTNS
jgi:antitoxin component YwqK of YwqJK toxin-antitoxin module